MDWLAPIDQAKTLCGALGALALVSFLCTKAAEILGLLK